MATEAEEMKNTWLRSGFRTWHVESEERSGRLLWRPQLAPLKRVIRSSWRGSLPVPTGQEHPYPQDTEKTPKRRRSLLQVTHSLCPNDTSPQMSTLHQTGFKTLKSNCFFRSSFPYEGPKIMSNLTLISILFSWCCHFNFQTQPRTLRG